MRRFIKVLYSNKFVAWAMLLFQLIVLAAGYYWISEYSIYVIGATSILGTLLLIYEVNRSDSPEFKMTWMLLIAIIPVFGALLYIYLRFGFISKSILKEHKAARQHIRPYIITDEKTEQDIWIKDPHSRGLVHYLKNIADAPVYTDSSVTYFKLGEIMYEDMKKKMEEAKRFIFMEFFIINSQSSMWEELFEILCRKAKSGVEVRLMYDGMGSLMSIPKGFMTIIQNAGIKCAAFAPVQPLLSTYQNNRDHRKIIVIDGEVAFTGGINIADEYVNRIDRFGHWKDNGIRVTGDAVSRFTALFLEMWNTVEDRDRDFEKYIFRPDAAPDKTDGYIIPYGDSPLDGKEVGKRVYLDIINNAESYVYIMTPYLVIDNETYEALRYAVDRGVDVKIIIPHRPDKVYAYWLAHTYFPELIRAGIKMYEYEPGFIHAKTVLSDGKKAVVGTINFDFRSLYLHYECAVYMMGVKAIAEMEEDFKDMIYDKVIPTTMTEYKKFNPLTILLGRAIRALAPLL